MCEEKLVDMMELGYVMSKIEEIEKLKTILLSTQQLSVFNILSKDVCSFHSDSVNSYEFSILKEFQKDKQKMNEAISDFKDLIRNEEMDHINWRLIKQLPCEIKEMIL